MIEDAPLFPCTFLLDASKNSLQEALLNRLSDASNREKHLRELLDMWAERRAEILLIRWFLKHGDELMAAITASPRVTEMKTVSLPPKPGPVSASDFRKTLQTLVESA